MPRPFLVLLGSLIAFLVLGCAPAAQPTASSVVTLAEDLIASTLPPAPPTPTLGPPVPTETIPVPTPTPIGGSPVLFATEGWESQEIANAIGMFIVGKGYGKPVSSVTMASTQQMQLGFGKGTITVDLNLQTANIEDWYQAQRRRKVVDRGNLYETGVQGWYVPSYVTDIKTVDDLKAKAASAGKFISCPKDFSCAQINKIKLTSYGIPDSLQVVEPASWADYFKAVNDAIAAKQPFVTYYRAPTSLAAHGDLARIEEPTYNPLCWARIRSVQQGTKDVKDLTESCAYPTAPVLKAVTRFLTDTDLQQFFFNMSLGDNTMNKLIEYMRANKASAQEAAIVFLRDNAVTWNQWVPGDVALKVRAALDSQDGKGPM